MTPRLGAADRELAHVLDRHDDLQVELLRDAGVDELDRPRRRRRSARSPRAGAASPRARCAGTACATSRSSRSSESARCAPRFVPATACTSSMITRVDAAQQLARLRGQHQEERLGRRDQDVRRRRAASPRAPSAACRPCAPRRSAATAARRAARAGCARRRSSAPSAARRRGRAAPRPASASAGRSRRGTRRASCPSRSAPGSACARRDAITGQPFSCAGVGAANVRSNQRLRRLGEDVERAHPTSYSRSGGLGSSRERRPDRLYFTEDDEANAVCSRPTRSRSSSASRSTSRSRCSRRSRGRSGSSSAPARSTRSALARTRSRAGVQGEAGRPPLPRLDGAARAGSRRVRSREEYGGDAARIWTEAADGDDLRARLAALPGFGEMKVRTLAAVLANRFGVDAGAGDRAEPPHASATSTRRRRSSTTRPRSARYKAEQRAKAAR